VAQRDAEIEGMRRQLDSGASASKALQAATSRADELAQQVRVLESRLRGQASQMEEAIKVLDRHVCMHLYACSNSPCSIRVNVVGIRLPLHGLRGPAVSEHGCTGEGQLYEGA
jgi:hypothetical protein